jgi:type I restriction enzyme, S subunit
VPMEAISPGLRWVRAASSREYKGGGARFADGDVLFARITPCLENGKIAQFRGLPGEPAWGSTEFVVFRSRADVSDPAYIYYLALTPTVRDPAKASMSGASGRQRADRGVIEATPVPAPPLHVQRKVSTVLSAYDELIENNRRRVEVLEKMTKALFAEWFVHHRFPGHEDVAIVDSSLGPVPDGWEPVTIADAIDLNPRVRLPRDEEFRFVQMGSLVEGSMVIDGYEIRSGPSGSRFRNGDTLLARITPSLENGKTGFVQFLLEGEVACGSTEFIVMRSRTVTPEFVYLLARTEDFRGLAVKSMVGASGRQRVQESSISKYRFAHPDSPTLQRFRDVVSPMFRMVQNLVDQNSNLRATRDLLLPKLVSGEIDVSELDIDTGWLAS